MFTCSVVQLVQRIRGRELSPIELVKDCISRIDYLQPELNAFTEVCTEDALSDAREAERKILQGEKLGPLHGIPFAVKDLLLTKGVTTTFGSYMYQNNIPTVDALSIGRLKQAGAILIGKTTTSEFGHKAITDSPLFGATRNPWNIDRTSGGSSGGSAVAVAAGMCPMAVGTDGGGSIRIPSSCCGIVGLKPTLGQVPHPQSPDVFGSLLHIGPMARTVSDVALIFDVMSGIDEGDPYSYSVTEKAYSTLDMTKVAELLKDRRIAWSPLLGNAKIDREVGRITEEAIKVFCDFGCEVEEIDPCFSSPEESFTVIVYSGLATRLGEKVSFFRGRIDKSLEKAIEMGNHFSAVDLQRANSVRTDIFRSVQRLFTRFDLLITPTLAALPVLSGVAGTLTHIPLT